MTPRTSWRMPQGRGDLSGCGAHDQTVGPCAGEASPATERGNNGGTDTSSASGRVAVPRSPTPQDGFRTLTAAQLRSHRAQARISYAAVQLIRAQLIRRRLEQARQSTNGGKPI